MTRVGRDPNRAAVPLFAGVAGIEQTAKQDRC